MKGYKTDYFVFFVAVVIMVVVFNVIPDHLGTIIRGVVALLIAGLVFAAYVFGLRKSDSLLELEELVRISAVYAKEILRIGKTVRNERLSEKISEIGLKIVHVATKVLTRDLTIIDVHVRRLARTSKDFRTVLSVLTGDVNLGRATEAEISEIKTKKIPETLQVLEFIEEAVDAIEAKKYLAAEDDLDTLTQMADLSEKTSDTVEMLKAIIRENPEGAK